MVNDQLNVEYWFRLLYECIYGRCYGSADGTKLLALIAQLWTWITIIGYAVSVVALFIIVYTTVRLFELRKREEEYYGKLIPSSEGKETHNARWDHIGELLESTNVSDWRTAIIESDILLEDALTEQGYVGESVGEKLKSANQVQFKSLDDAWEAHKVRNQIAHQGSTFDLTDTLARRTIARYENVFRELKVI